jgi:hypothetical protein
MLSPQLQRLIGKMERGELKSEGLRPLLQYAAQLPETRREITLWHLIPDGQLSPLIAMEDLFTE